MIKRSSYLLEMHVEIICNKIMSGICFKITWDEGKWILAKKDYTLIRVEADQYVVYHNILSALYVYKISHNKKLKIKYAEGYSKYFNE